MTEDRRKQLIAEIEGSEELCKYCPLDENFRGVYSTSGGSTAGCEGRRCPEAIEAYLDEREEQEELCIRCGEKPAMIPGNYCKECDERIDNGPVSRFFQAGGTKEEFETIANG